MDRKGEHPVKHLSGYQGWVHADGYAGFNDVFGNDKASEVACMAHNNTAERAMKPVAVDFRVGLTHFSIWC